jgi:purine-binding chemotaxis protein CheW
MAANVYQTSKSSTLHEEEKLVDDKKYLTFRLGDEQYGVSIDYVIEIIEVIKITQLPDMQQYIKGVINLRGKVIPVMDVRLRFNIEERAYDSKTCIIVVKVNDFEIGLIVDTVSEVINIDDQQIDVPPQMHSSVEHHYIMGIAKVDKHVVILIDISKILFGVDVQKLAKAC